MQASYANTTSMMIVEETSYEYIETMIYFSEFESIGQAYTPSPSTTKV